MKPILRWNIGPTTPEGLRILARNLKSEVLADFEVIVCFNQIKPSIDAKLINCEDYIHTLPKPPKKGFNVHWKLFPPRLDITRHELVIDNDILLFRRPKEIDLFLGSDSVLLYQGLHGLYGQFDNVPQGLRINSGIYGLPPGYDFSGAIKNFIGEKDWSNYFDEQGLVASCLSRYHTKHMISLVQVPIIESDWDCRDFVMSETCGFHFVGINRNANHNGWRRYENRTHL